MWEIFLNPIFWVLFIVVVLSIYQIPQKHIALPSIFNFRIPVRLNEGFRPFLPLCEMNLFTYERQVNPYYFYGEQEIDTHIGAVEAMGDIAYSINKNISGKQLKLLDEKAPSHKMIASALESFLHVILHEALLSKDEQEITDILNEGAANTKFRKTLIKSLQEEADKYFGTASLLIEWTNFRMNPSAVILEAKKSIEAMTQRAKAEEERKRAIENVARAYSGVPEGEPIPQYALVVAASQMGVPRVDLNISEHVIRVPDPIKVEGLEGAAEGIGKLADAFLGDDNKKSTKDKGGE